jgi:hypothetical protein
LHLLEQNEVIIYLNCRETEMPSLGGLPEELVVIPQVETPQSQIQQALSTTRLASNRDTNTIKIDANL